ncbi:hypothetical protein WH47_01794 [Habropoda laboriosa]|uniref:Uncharacterized protein n=1 Tax=Habropoda laboriosa TaxID=597456 RepID=A0A0L7QTL7_9HYME|nr:PREDICTED: uncharacterized protein LOC108575384 [Habropoda laboriosa]KOC62002.1 hypothetical protein WH47_01794 [Habropoda laboriosa]
MRFLMFILMVIAAFTVVLPVRNKPGTCSKWKGKCYAYEDCCRYLVCPTYEGRCVLKPGIIVPGEDTRPIGDGPFPPGYPDF